MYAFVLRMVRRALLGATGVCGVALVVAISRDDVPDTATFGLLLALCLAGLAVKTADKRPTA